MPYIFIKTQIFSYYTSSYSQRLIQHLNACYIFVIYYTSQLERLSPVNKRRSLEYPAGRGSGKHAQASQEKNELKSQPQALSDTLGELHSDFGQWTSHCNDLQVKLSKAEKLQEKLSEMEKDLLKKTNAGDSDQWFSQGFRSGRRRRPP